MSPFRDQHSPRRLLVALLAGVVALTAATIVAVALAKTPPRTTLRAESAKSVGAKVLADHDGRSLYRLKPETARHVLCRSDACLAVWPPATVRSKSTHVVLPRGAVGKIGFLRRGKRFQLTYRALPLYRFAGDGKAHQANGQHIHSFGGVWSVLRISKNSSAPSPVPVAPRSY